MGSRRDGCRAVFLSRAFLFLSLAAALQEPLLVVLPWPRVCMPAGRRPGARSVTSSPNSWPSCRQLRCTASAGFPGSEPPGGPGPVSTLASAACGAGGPGATLP